MKNVPTLVFYVPVVLFIVLTLVNGITQIWKFFHPPPHWSALPQEANKWKMSTLTLIWNWHFFHFLECLLLQEQLKVFQNIDFCTFYSPFPSHTQIKNHWNSEIFFEKLHWINCSIQPGFNRKKVTMSLKLPELPS